MPLEFGKEQQHFGEFCRPNDLLLDIDPPFWQSGLKDGQKSSDLPQTFICNPNP